MRRLDKILLVSTNYTCWEKHPPKGQFSEIIELAGCLLDVKSGDISDVKSYVVRPSVSELSSYCTALYKINRNTIDKDGMNFDVAYSKFVREFNPQFVSWATYEFVDKRKIEVECKQYNLKFPLSNNHFCVSDLLSLKYKFNSVPVLTEAVEFVGSSYKGVPHRAHDSVFNAAVVLRKVLWTQYTT